MTGPLERAVSESFFSATFVVKSSSLDGASLVVAGGGYLLEPWNSAETWKSVDQHRPPCFSEEEDE